MSEPRRLDPNVPQETQYAVPLWLRDEQIRQAVARGLPRIEPHQALRDQPIAIVCYGPSLNDTWERIRDFKFVMSCSGAHRFLLERGIVPTWHVEVDPRAHKAALIGPPHPDVEYLIASTCHAAVFDHLQAHRVRLWHVFDSKADAERSLPRGEWALTGGCSVGLRTLTIARFLGFTDQHVFGMDGSEGATGKHAAEHPNQPQGHAICEYEGVEYRTTAAMLEAARGTWHELNQMPDVKATFYGEGLVQHMARKYVPRPVGEGKAIIGVIRPPLISAEYRQLNTRLHHDNVTYGAGGGKHAPIVLKLIESVKTHSVLDYGCGRGYLGKALAEHGIPIWEYDPAIPGKDESPRAADLVVCTDVLEHVEPDKIVYVLDDLRRVTRKVGYFVIHTGPSSKLLADGRNAHVLQRDRAWWEGMLRKFFHVATIMERYPLLYIVVGPQKIKAKATKAQAEAVA